MTLLAVLFSYIAILALVPPGSAGPACARKHFKSQECIERCKGKFGYPGYVMNTDRWGAVIQPSSVSAASWNSMISQACGMQSSSSSSSTPISVPAGAIGNDPPSTDLPVVTTRTTSSATVQSTTATVSSTISSISLSSSASSSASTTSSFSFGFSFDDSPSTQNFAPQSTEEPSSSPPPSPTTSSTPPPPPSPTTSSTPPPETTSTKAQDPPKNSGSSNDSGSNNSGSNNSGSNDSGSSDSGSNNSGSSGNSGTTSNSDIQAYLSAHNSVRAQHGAAPLTWSDEAAAKAQQWANNCVFEHSGGKLGAFGENLAAGTGDSYGIAEAIKSWTDEVSSYNPGNPSPSHFTQVVWKATTQVGCAVQSCDGIFDASFGKAKFFVCEYTPQGNVIGQFDENVQA
ncbi:hypothetical protein VKT23_005701 [Stygiomarasmius scandens]|uniref:SCP domain-containing protein n=1 Tax=Marasmiellus scandens TaxID=2682957 RepID=A0ABR1JRG1_9AGAR